MAEALRVLHLEDDPLDAELVRSTLAAGGFGFEFDRVETREEFEGALDRGGYGLILSDLTLPAYDGVSALARARTRRPEVPFIFVSGTMGEDAAIESLLSGATDYVLKHKLSRLVPAVRRAMHEAEERRARRDAQGALCASELRYRGLFEASSDGIFIVDGERGEVLDVNERCASMWGRGRDELLGAPLWDLGLVASSDDWQQLVGDLQAVSCVRRELELAPQSGEPMHVECVASSYDVAWRTVVQVSARDVSVRWSAEQEIRRLNAELERRVAERTAQLEAAYQDLEGFAYSVSHDLRAPLRAIGGFARILAEERGAALGDEGRRLLQVVRDNARRMDELIDDILAFSKMGRTTMRQERVRMSALAEEALRSLPNCSRPGLEVVLGPMPDARGDPAMLRQVLVNLLGNAIKFTGPRPSARVEAGGTMLGPESVYYVRDNGVGFDPQQADRLFGVFQRLHDPKEFEGTGIGLAIVKRVIVRHGGRVWAESTPGEGAAFFFTLPSDA